MIPARFIVATSGAGAVVTGAVAEITVIAAEAAGVTLESVSLLVGIVTFLGSFISATFMLGGRVRDWSRAHDRATQELAELRVALAAAATEREALIRALLRAGVIDEDVRGIPPGTREEP